MLCFGALLAAPIADEYRGSEKTRFARPVRVSLGHCCVLAMGNHFFFRFGSTVLT